MQQLEIISFNLWQVLISLCNLLLIFLLLKKFLYKPVKKMMAQRQAQIDDQYAAAEEAQKAAEASKAQWEEKMATTKEQADEILQNATAQADRRGDAIVAQAKEKADGIVRQAQAQADLELKKAESQIKKEIVDVSSLLSEKMLGREINTEDHRALIDSFLEEIGEEQ